MQGSIFGVGGYYDTDRKGKKFKVKKSSEEKKREKRAVKDSKKRAKQLNKSGVYCESERHAIGGVDDDEFEHLGKPWLAERQKAVLKGYLLKSRKPGDFFKGSYKKRFLCLYDDKHMDYSEYSDTQPMGSIELQTAVSFGATTKIRQKWAFDIVTPERTWFLAAQSRDQFDLWTSAIKQRIPDRSADKVVKRGWLTKEGGSKGSRSLAKAKWSPRYFSLHEGFMVYFRKEEEAHHFEEVLKREQDMIDFSDAEAAGLLPLRSSTLLWLGRFHDHEHVFAIEVAFGGRVFYACGKSEQESRQWMEAITREIKREEGELYTETVYEEEADWEREVNKQAKQLDDLDPFAL